MQFDRRTLLSGVAVGMAALAGCSNTEDDGFAGMSTIRGVLLSGDTLTIYVNDAQNPSVRLGEDLTHVVLERRSGEYTVVREFDFGRDVFVVDLGPEHTDNPEIDGRYVLHSISGGPDPTANIAKSLPLTIQNGELTLFKDRIVGSDAGQQPPLSTGNSSSG